MLRFYVNGDKFVSSIHRTAVYNKEKIINDAGYFSESFERYRTSGGSCNGYTGNIKINLHRHSVCFRNRNIMILIICQTITHEFLHRTLNEFKIPIELEERLIDSIINSIY